MSDAISEEKYRQTLDEEAAWLTEAAIEAARNGEYDIPQEAALELSEDVPTDHNWFARDYYGSSLYGCIIEFAETDPSTYDDWEVACDQPTPQRAVEHIASLAFQADVISLALDRIAEE